MTLATRADLEALRGAEYVDRLLSAAADIGDALSEDQKSAKLAAALQAGDDFVAQFLPLPKSPSDPSYQVLRRFAIEEAFYTLQRHSSVGADSADREAADERRRDLAYMRKRDQFPGTPEGQRTATPTTVPSSSPMALHKLIGLI